MPTRGRETTCSRCGQSVTEFDGASLREIRLAHSEGISLRSAAAKLGVSPSYLSDVELNRRRATPKVIRFYEMIEGW